MRQQYWSIFTDMPLRQLTLAPNLNLLIVTLIFTIFAQTVRLLQPETDVL